MEDHVTGGMECVPMDAKVVTMVHCATRYVHMYVTKYVNSGQVRTF